MKDIAFTSELVVTTLKAFGLEAKDSSRIIDVFASSAAKSVSSLDKISASLKYTAGLWGAQRWDIENLVGTLDVLYDTGVRGEKAGRLLASAINGLNKPTASASKVIQRLLGDVNALNPSMNDITSIVKKLAQANATTTDVFTIFGKEGTEVILRLLSNVGKLDSAIADVTGQTGEATKQALIKLQSFASQFDILKNKIQFVQVGEKNKDHIHPELKNVINLIGKTDTRQLIRLSYHAQGAVCPVTFQMHLMGAYQKPCVVLAGGREPRRWEMYPHHRYIDTNGLMACCAYDGCWMSGHIHRNEPGSPNKQCVNVVGWDGDVNSQRSKCMAMISPERVAFEILSYYEGGILQW
jgi:hypothetical protein